jgi:hypothetical protein
MSHRTSEMTQERFADWLVKSLGEAFGIAPEVLEHGRRTCLSCGAKQSKDGSLPCGH